MSSLAKQIRFLIVGDIVGQPGQLMFQKHILALKADYKIDAIIVNGENAAHNGRGIIEKQIQFFKHNDVDVITSGNHIWAQRESYVAINKHSDFILRPANFPAACPGKGYTLFQRAGVGIAVINVQGRVFMHQHVDCPFRTTESLLKMLTCQANIIIVDFHAEATSEKKSLGFFLDGKVSAVVGTHTHVPTADEQILPQGTAYATDIGFCGALHSSLGMEKESVLQNFLTQMPQRFSVEKKGPYVLNALAVCIDSESGKAIKIERIRIIDEQVQNQL